MGGPGSGRYPGAVPYCIYGVGFRADDATALSMSRSTKTLSSGAVVKSDRLWFRLGAIDEDGLVAKPVMDRSTYDRLLNQAVAAERALRKWFLAEFST